MISRKLFLLYLRNGLQAAKANWLAAVILQSFALAIILGYYFHPPTQALLEQVASLKTHWGFLFSFVSTSIFGGILPFIFQQIQPATRQPFRPSLLLFMILFWGYRGMEVDFLYHALARLLGDTQLPWVVVTKILIDQFLYAPFWALPQITLMFLWKDQGFSFRRARQAVGQHWYLHRVVSVIMPNWAVWIPTVAIIYSIKLPLQLPVMNIILCLWNLILMYLIRQQETHE